MVGPFLIRRNQIAVKIEGTEGVDAVPADADVVAPAYNIEWSPSFEQFERDIVQSSFSRLSQISGERSATISFATELKGSGVVGDVPANLSAALRACGLSETIVAVTSVTYAPASETIPSVTIEIREGAADGTFKSKKILGARGTFTIEAVKGDVVLVNFEFTGKYVEPTDTVAFATPSPGGPPIPFLNAGISFQGVGTLKLQNITLDMANEVTLRNDANDATGNTAAVIVSRTPSGSIDPEQEAVGVINFFNKLTANAEGVLTYNLTGAAGNIMVFTANKTQIVAASEGDRDSIRIEELDLQFNQDTDAGDDEFAIVFT